MYKPLNRSAGLKLGLLSQESYPVKTMRIIRAYHDLMWQPLTGAAEVIEIKIYPAMFSLAR